MRDLLGVSPGERLGLDAYRDDFRSRDFAVDGCDSWKLERRQHFREPGDASWDAFVQGDWEEALRLIEAQRAELLDVSRLAARHRCRLLRVRVVEQPLTPYLQWELHLLRVRAECGELIRVIGPEHIEAYEHGGTVPELVTLNDDTVYEILYDAEGVLEGGVRYLGAGTRDRVAARVEELYVLGEDIGTFFDREVAHLKPPTGV
ncbi:DUF6879 family protein [Streptomyces roseochromogenus]|uniref:DUF6879 domain-containing protein n=1 Tax=Streptomyces roseochromogenus subsp. oscitans DS 12.976 TaxID=1352936 RepID=V6K1U7_STRRC|nr:DUF6879 family protein [Streptomyces roseochromogenus]EST25376.1 hypothetical protein M878_28945 [Streptomyces roseochromogenus subsp. oscitans DS 12.976]